MSRHAAALALSAIVLAAGAALPSAPAHAGGEVLDRAPARYHHRHQVRRITLIEERAPVVRYADPVLQAPVDAGPRIRRGNFHGRFVGGNYAYNSAYQEVLTATNNRYLESQPRVTPFVAPDLVDPDAPDSVYNSGVPYSRSNSVPERGGGGIYDKSTSLMPAPTRGIFYENRTRDAYVYSYDYETENPACWSRQTIAGREGVQVRSVWTCAGR